MAEPADGVSRVAVVVSVTPEGRVEAELSAFLDRVDLLVDRVDRLQDPSVQLLELAQFDRFLDAVVLQVVESLSRNEGARPCHRQPVHVGHVALSRAVVVVGGPGNKKVGIIVAVCPFWVVRNVSRLARAKTKCWPATRAVQDQTF